MLVENSQRVGNAWDNSGAMLIVHLHLLLLLLLKPFWRHIDAASTPLSTAVRTCFQMIFMQSYKSHVICLHVYVASILTQV